MTTRSRPIVVLAFAILFGIVAVGCSSDSDDSSADGGTTSSAAPAGNGEEDVSGEDGSEEGGSEDGASEDVPSVEIKPFDEIDVCGLIMRPDIESVLGDEVIEPQPEVATKLPFPLTSDVEPDEAAGCFALSSEVTDAGVILRLFRFPSADDAAAVAATLSESEELEGTQADVAFIRRTPIPDGFSYSIVGAVGDVLISIQAQSVPGLTDPATQIATLNGTISGLQRA